MSRVYAQTYMVLKNKPVPEFKDFVARAKCFFGKHQLLPMGHVSMYGLKSFVVEIDHILQLRNQ